MRTHAPLVLVAALAASGCSSMIEVPVDTPLQSKLDVSSFRRILIAGFVTDLQDSDVDLSAETSRLLQRQDIVVHNVSEFSISAACSRKQFESLFRTRLVKKPMPQQGFHVATVKSYLAPDTRVLPPAVEGLADLVERVYVCTAAADLLRRRTTDTTILE